jgi:hypothetical protein
MSHVYLLHFDPPFKHAQHYVGYTGRDEVASRVFEHQTGQGAVLTRHAVRAGCTVVLARTWPDVPRKFELKIKGRSLKPLCPICKQLKTSTKKGNGKCGSYVNAAIAKSDNPLPRAAKNNGNVINAK